MGAGGVAAGVAIGYLVATRDKNGKQVIQIVDGTEVDTSPIVKNISNVPNVSGGGGVYIPQASGFIYENEMVMGSDDPKRFHDKPTVVSDILVRVSSNDMVFGNENNQRFEAAAGDVFSIRECDLSTLWFRNKVNGSNGKVNVLGTRR